MTAVAFDSNILLYIEGVERNPGDRAKADRATRLLDQLAGHIDTIVALHALGEVYTVLTRSGFSRDNAHSRVAAIQGWSRPAVTSETVFSAALAIAVRHKLQLWDSIILAASNSAGADFLLSEDMQDGFSWRGTTVVNPLAGDFDVVAARLTAR